MLCQVVGGCAGEEGRGKELCLLFGRILCRYFAGGSVFIFIFVFVSFYIVYLYDDLPILCFHLYFKSSFLHVGDDVLYLMQLPDVPGGYRRIKIFLKCAYNIHKFKRIQAQILDEVRFVVEIRFSGNVENNLLNEFQHDKSPFRPYVFLFFLMLFLKIPAP